MGRVFFLASHKCAGASGGGHGVVFRLYQADKKYQLFKKEVIYVFGDRVIKGYDELGDYLEQKDVPKQSNFRIKIKEYIPSVLRIVKMEKMYKGLDDYLGKLDREFEFQNDDVFICHDFRIARAFVRKFKLKNYAFVHHMQGSIYFEWHAETGINSKMMQNYYNKTFREITSRIRYLCFPSKGTEESLVDSEPSIANLVETANKKYLYNGVNCPEINPDKLTIWVNEIKSMHCYKFVTVANLNAAKAVERIPQYLNAIKRAGISLKWILVGNGVKAEEVEKQIKKYGLENDVIWKKNGVPHDELMELFSITDFYILLHKYSIFDLSTLEAMHYGNVPILTPVGGNKEVIIENNGLFVSDFGNADSFVELITANRLETIKARNTKIQNENFDDRAFLQRYVDLCNGF